MSMAVKLSAGASEIVSTPREKAYFWTLVLILGTIAAAATGTWFYVDAAPLIDPSMVAP